MIPALADVFSHEQLLTRLPERRRQPCDIRLAVRRRRHHRMVCIAPVT
ncbi:hypothetical protein LTSEMIN_2583, partial [Salmonella enterica subsp. enterica serovar Minnesota str. A4-603]